MTPGRPAWLQAWIDPLTIAGLMAMNYTLVCANIRWLSQGRILPTVASDAAIAVVGWTLTRTVATATTWQERLGYVVGAMIGSVIGIRLT